MFFLFDMSRKSRQDLMGDVVSCLIQRSKLLTEGHLVPGKMPGAEDTRIIKKRSLPSGIT